MQMRRQPQRHWLHHWWFRAIIIVALVLALMLAVRLHSATGSAPHAYVPSCFTIAFNASEPHS